MLDGMKPSKEMLRSIWEFPRPADITGVHSFFGLVNTPDVLPPLKIRDIVSVQNQTGRQKLKWDGSGVIIKVLPHNQYRKQEILPANSSTSQVDL